ACHSDQALALIDSPSDYERAVLAAIPYQKNTALLHSDPGVMPRHKLAWASWNYRVPRSERGVPVLSYHMNRLQNLSIDRDYFVTLNAPELVAEKTVHAEMVYHHPLFTVDGIAAQQQHGNLNGQNRCFYVGAYWRYGFHEDG